MTDRTLDTASSVIPHLRDAPRVILLGTPSSFEHFTKRQMGWVGGFPQTHLFRNQGLSIAPSLWMVGDSIFPGQSFAGVSLGGSEWGCKSNKSLESENLAWRKERLTRINSTKPIHFEYQLLK